MGWLKRLLGGGEPPAASQQLQVRTFTQQRPDAELEVVGESHYQGNLGRFAGRRTEDGVTNEFHTALLIPEPDNQYDPNAIAVHLRGGGQSALKVGHLSRADAEAYQPVFRTIAPSVISTEARLKGGWDNGPDDQGMIGVVLHLGTPDELLSEARK